MPDLPRRSVLKSLCTLLGGACLLGGKRALAGDDSLTAALPPLDEQALRAPYEPSVPLPPIEHPFAQYAFKEHIVSACDPSEHLIVTSVRHPKPVRVFAGKLEAFFAGPSNDAVARSGGIDWTCGDEQGTVTFQVAPWLVMVIRTEAGQAHWYSMGLIGKC